jgi:hypothetical protein
MNTIVDAVLGRTRAAADENLDGIGVRCLLRQEHSGPGEGICPPARIVVYGTRDFRQCGNGLEGGLVENGSLVVVYFRSVSDSN